jgi:Effector-associated domain 1
MAVELLTNEEIVALADAFQGSAARTLLSRAGFPAWAVPERGYTNSLEFWSKIAEQLARGVMDNGRNELLAAAHHQFPYNERFGVAPTSSGTVRSGQAISVAESQGILVGEHNIQVNVFTGQPADDLPGREHPRTPRSGSQPDGEEGADAVNTSGPP